MSLAPLALRGPSAPLWADNWSSRGACATQDPDDLFVAGRAQRDAKKVCAGCPVVVQCLAEALDNRTEFGVWGGMTERERRALLRRRPEVTDWRAVLTGNTRVAV